MILSSADVFWLVAFGQFVGTLGAAMVVVMVWLGMDSAGRAASRRRKAAKAPRPAQPARPAEPERPPGRHHTDVDVDRVPRRGDPSSTFPGIPRIGPPPPAGGLPPWPDAESPAWDRTGLRARPTMRNRTEPDQ